jgi:hypothetical protein
MRLADMLYASHPLDLPLDTLGNFYNLQFSAVTICLSAELPDHLHELLVVSGDEHATPIQTWLSWPRRLRPIRAEVWFLERLLLPQLSQPKKSLVAQAKPAVPVGSITRIDDDLSH